MNFPDSNGMVNNIAQAQLLDNQLLADINSSSNVSDVNMAQLAQRFKQQPDSRAWLDKTRVMNSELSLGMLPNRVASQAHLSREQLKWADQSPKFQQAAESSLESI